MQKIRIGLETENIQLIPQFNKMLPDPVHMIQGDLLKFTYTLECGVINIALSKHLDLIIELLEDSSVNADTTEEELTQLDGYVNLVSEINQKLIKFLSTLKIKRILQNKKTLKDVIQKISEPNYQPNDQEKALVEALCALEEVNRT